METYFCHYVNWSFHFFSFHQIRFIISELNGEKYAGADVQLRRIVLSSPLSIWATIVGASVFTTAGGNY
jgi:hypothetical protein